MINTKTRQLYKSLCTIISESNLPPVNVELILTLLLKDVTQMTNEEMARESEDKDE